MKYGFTINDGVLTNYGGPILNCDTDIVVPEGVTAIGERAFWYRRGIDNVKLPESVKSIGKEAFGICEGMRWVSMPKEMTEIGERAFVNCLSLLEIVIPDGVTEIHTNTFYKCKQLKTVVLPRSLTLIDAEAFNDCFLLSKIIFKGTKKEWNAVYKGYNWNNSTFGVSVICTEFDEGEKNPPEDFKIENGVLKKYRGADSTVAVPEGVTVIANNAFVTMDPKSNLYRVIFPEGVTDIENGAFSFYTQLNEIYVPGSVVNFTREAFFAMYCVKTIVYNGTKEQWLTLEKNNGTFFSDVTVKCTDETLVR